MILYNWNTASGFLEISVWVIDTQYSVPSRSLDTSSTSPTKFIVNVFLAVGLAAEFREISIECVEFQFLCEVSCLCEEHKEMKILRGRACRERKKERENCL